MADIDAFVQAEADALVRELSEWCAIPSISSDPERAGDVRRSAEHPGRADGGGRARHRVLAAEGGQPAVYGEWLGAGAEAPTVTVYGHHDVQPADPLEEWTTPPFEPTVRDGYLRARGASDDKGQIHFQVSAIRHLLAADGRLPVNVKFFVEGGGVGVAHDRRVPGRARRPAGLRPHLCLRHRDGRRGRAVAGHGHARARLLQVDLRTARPTCTRARSGAVPNALAELVRLLAEAQGRGRAHRHPGLVRRRGRADRRGAGQLRRPCRSTPTS